MQITGRLDCLSSGKIIHDTLIFKFKNHFILCIWIFLLNVCMCTDVLGTCRGQQRALDPLELELQKVVSSYEGAGNCTGVHWTISSAPIPHF